METWLEEHLANWLGGFAGDDPEYRAETERKIRAMLDLYPDAIEDGRSWPEILNLAERNSLSLNVCHRCGHRICGNSYVLTNGRPYCRQCHLDRCRSPQRKVTP